MIAARFIALPVGGFSAHAVPVTGHAQRSARNVPRELRQRPRAADDFAAIRMEELKHGASAAMPVAVVTPRIWAPSGIPTWTPTVRIPRSAPPEPDAGSDVSPDTRSRPAPPIWSAPICVSIGRWQSKSDAERQDESGENRFHARESTLNRDEVFPPKQKKSAALPLHRAPVK